MDRSELTIHDEEIELRDPVLVAAFRGWNDAGEAASLAAQHLTAKWSGKKLASIEPEEYYDFQAVRPYVRLEDGVTRRISWPSNEFWAARPANASHDVIMLVGTEPNLRWKRFSRLIVELARAYDVSLVITLGALLADVPHSRPVQITGTAMNQNLIQRLRL
ncbi:MAG: PAC2 family protein, partial [Actinomycetota bacterium]|nr:PAC2 family protein [Actinomycetota bacterium]